MFNIKCIKSKVSKCQYYLTKHGEQERQNDSITIAEIEEALINGIILEQYEDDLRGESCLVAGFSEAGKPIHIVCGKFENDLVLITVYIPTPPKFITPYERGIK